MYMCICVSVYVCRGEFGIGFEAISKRHKDKTHYALKGVDKHKSCAKTIHAEVNPPPSPPLPYL